MSVEIKQLKRSDFDKARKFAIDGMHLNWYATTKIELYIYSKYFWYDEILKATKVLGAYIDNELAGVLLADIKNEPKIFKSVRYQIFIKTISFITELFYKRSSNAYEDANEKMLTAFKKNNSPDGEINFFAVNPEIKGKGIGTLLLNELERLEKGKLVYLYTDSGSTYQFYRHRGFTESGRTQVKLELSGKKMDLTCFLFSKRL